MRRVSATEGVRGIVMLSPAVYAAESRDVIVSVAVSLVAAEDEEEDGELFERPDSFPQARSRKPRAEITAKDAAMRKAVLRGPFSSVATVEAKGSDSGTMRCGCVMLFSRRVRAAAAFRGRPSGCLASKLWTAAQSGRGTSSRNCGSGGGCAVACLTSTAEAIAST